MYQLNLDQQDPKVKKDNQEVMAQMARMETMVQMVGLVRKDQPVLPVPLGNLDPLLTFLLVVETRDLSLSPLLVTVDTEALMDLQENPALMAILDTLALRESEDTEVWKESEDHLVTLAIKENLVPLDPQVLLEVRDNMDLVDPLVFLVSPDSQDSKEMMVMLVVLVALEGLVQRDFLGRKEKLETRVLMETGAPME